MKSRLQQAGLLRKKDDALEINISLAWSLLSRLGCPARYGGKSQDGSHEYIVVHPHTGDFLATGKGLTLESSMCEAALNAGSLINTG